MSEFVAKHVKCAGSIRVEGAPDDVFSLFTPVREAEWIEGWAINVMHSESVLVNDEGAVFTTNIGGSYTVWIVTHSDAAARTIQYARITPHVQAVIIDVACTEHSEVESEVKVSYTLTGLSEAGNQRIEAFAATYEAMMGEWQAAVNHRLRTGEVLTHP